MPQDPLQDMLVIMCPDLCTRLGHIVPHVREWDCPSRKVARKLVEAGLVVDLVPQGFL